MIDSGFFPFSGWTALHKLIVRGVSGPFLTSSSTQTEPSFIDRSIKDSQKCDSSGCVVTPPLRKGKDAHSLFSTVALKVRDTPSFRKEFGRVFSFFLKTLGVNGIPLIAPRCFLLAGAGGVESFSLPPLFFLLSTMKRAIFPFLSEGVPLPPLGGSSLVTRTLCCWSLPFLFFFSPPYHAHITLFLLFLFDSQCDFFTADMSEIFSPTFSLFPFPHGGGGASPLWPAGIGLLFLNEGQIGMPFFSFFFFSPGKTRPSGLFFSQIH